MSRHTQNRNTNDRRERFQGRVLLEVPKHRREIHHSPRRDFYSRHEPSQRMSDRGNYQDSYDDEQSYHARSHYTEIDSLSDHFRQIDVIVSRGAHNDNFGERDSDPSSSICNSMMDKDERTLSDNFVNWGRSERNRSSTDYDRKTSYLRSLPRSHNESNKYPEIDERESEYFDYHHQSPRTVSVPNTKPYRTHSDTYVPQTDYDSEHVVPMSRSHEHITGVRSSSSTRYDDWDEKIDLVRNRQIDSGEAYDQSDSDYTTSMNSLNDNDYRKNECDQLSRHEMAGLPLKREVINYHHQSPTPTSRNEKQKGFRYSGSPQHKSEKNPKHANNFFHRFQYNRSPSSSQFSKREVSHHSSSQYKYQSYSKSGYLGDRVQRVISSKVKEQNRIQSQKYEKAHVTEKTKRKSQRSEVSEKKQKDIKDDACSSQEASSSQRSTKSEVRPPGKDQETCKPDLHHEKKVPSSSSNKQSEASGNKTPVVRTSVPSSKTLPKLQVQQDVSQAEDGQPVTASSKPPNPSVSTDSSVSQSKLPKSRSYDTDQSDMENGFLSIGLSDVSVAPVDESALKRDENHSPGKSNNESIRTSGSVAVAGVETISESKQANLDNPQSTGTINQSSLVISPEKAKQLQNLFLNNSPLLRKKLRTSGEGPNSIENNVDKTQTSQFQVDDEQHNTEDLENIEITTVEENIEETIVEENIEVMTVEETIEEMTVQENIEVMTTVDSRTKDVLYADKESVETAEPCRTDTSVLVEKSALNSSPLDIKKLKIPRSSVDDIQKLFKTSPVLKKMVSPAKPDKIDQSFSDMPVLVKVKDLSEKNKAVDSLKKLKTNSQNEINETDGKGDAAKDFACIYDLYDSDDIEIDSDLDSDEDDELVAAPSFLRSLEEAGRPLPATPEKLSQHSLESEDFHLEMPVLELQAPITSQFSLDQMLAEKIENADGVRKHKEMQTELKEHLRQGGFIKLTLEKPEEAHDDEMSLEQDQQQLLKNFQVSESAIMEVHPGDPVFQAQNYGQLFTESLSPQDCGFQPGESYVDGLLEDIQPADYDIILTSDALFDCLESVSCQSAVLRWLFFIMSVHNSHLIMEGCRQILCESIHTQEVFHKLPKTWAPTVQDILTILVNYGGDLNELLPDSGLVASDLRYTIAENNNQMLMQGNVSKFNRENMRRVITVVTVALQARPQYSSEDLTTLLKIFSKTALDKSLNNHCLDYEFSLCLTSLLQLYTDKDWSQQAIQLCRILAERTSNHHNQVHLLQLLLPNARTSCLRQRTSFIILQRMLFDRDDIPEEELADLKLNKLLRMVPVMRDYAHHDLYTLASMVNLLDICVGNDVLKSVEKDNMRTLTDQLKRLTSEVRDNVHKLDCTRIKDMMVRVTSKWTLVMQATGCKQKSIFAYTQHQDSPLMKIEAVHARQSDQSDDDDDKTDPDILKLNKNRDGNASVDNENRTSESSSRVDDLVKVVTDTVEKMDCEQSFDDSDEDILPDI